MCVLDLLGLMNSNETVLIRSSFVDIIAPDKGRCEENIFLFMKTYVVVTH